MIFSLQNNNISVRTQQYRLDQAGQLFDMVADPCQDRDVSKEKPEVAAKLSKAVAEWGKEMLPLVGKDDRPFPVGYSETTRSARARRRSAAAAWSAAPRPRTARTSPTGPARRTR